jgi:hypothetical protein
VDGADFGRTDRRTVLRASAAGALGLPGVARVLTTLSTAGAAQVAAQTTSSTVDPTTAATLEAYADTIVPGQPRFAGDKVIPGAAPGPSAVVAGFLDAACLPAVGISAQLPTFAGLFNQSALGYAQAAGLTLDPSLPPFVALPFAARTGLVGQLLSAAGSQAQQVCVLLASIASWAFDTAASMNTATAIASGHPGLAWLGFPAPQPDGRWRFPQNSYQRQLASISPLTSPCGSPS